MRCYCCDRPLTDVEATSKFKESGEYTNMCKKCQAELPADIKIVNRSDLENQDNSVEDFFDGESSPFDEDDYEEN